MTVVYDTNRKNLVNIYGPPGTAASVKGLLEFLNVSSEIRISDGTHTLSATKLFSGHDIGTGTIFQDANVKVTAVENTHFNFPPGSPRMENTNHTPTDLTQSTGRSSLPATLALAMLSRNSPKAPIC